MLFVPTKDIKIRERRHVKVDDPHYSEIGDDVTYFSIRKHPFSDLNNTMTVLSFPCCVHKSFWSVSPFSRSVFTPSE